MILYTLVLVGLAHAGAVPAVEKGPVPAHAASAQEWSGSLAAGDSTLPTGERYDLYTFEGRAGQTVSIRMTSSALDPYLGLHLGSTTLAENDDAATGEGALINITLPSDGTYTILATSYKAGERGAYDVALTIDDVASTVSVSRMAPAPAAPPATQVQGSLASGDAQLPTGEYFDDFRYPCVSGDHLSARATSSAFDTYVGLDMPSHPTIENDDAPSGQGAYAEGTVTDAGTCRVFVTSYKPGESGAYTLEMSGFGSAATPATAAAPPTPAATPTGVDVLGPQLDAALRSWATQFSKDKAFILDSDSQFTKDWATNLRIDGATDVTIVDHLTFGIVTETTLQAKFGTFGDAASGLPAYRALVARVQSARTPCCTFAASEHDSEIEYSTAWLPFDLGGTMGVFKDAMIDVSLVQTRSLVNGSIVRVWELDLNIYHTP